MKYINKDINNPKYLFHGSPHKLKYVKPKRSYDSLGIKENISTSVFLTPIFEIATAYSFKDSIKEKSNNLNWNFEITNSNQFPIMTMKNVNVDDEMIGYIYVFLNNKNFIKDKNSYQYKCYEIIKPIDIIEIKYKDFKHLYKVENQNIIK